MDMNNVWAGGTHCIFPLLCCVMPSIKNSTNMPIVRDNTALNLSQSGLACANPIDLTTSYLLKSITYNWKQGFNLEWNFKEAFKIWLNNE